ncbi:MAG: DUF1338 family protein [Gammaproteobacteria bacterium]
MSESKGSTLENLLGAALSKPEVGALLAMVDVPRSLVEEDREDASRAVIAEALCLLLFWDLLRRVPTGRRYVEEARAGGRKIVFDHGALRTVALESMGRLPAGYRSISRVLEPLGYSVTGLYPLGRIGMTGRAFTHLDLPESIPQFFVSELHPENFSDGFQKIVRGVLATSVDPLSDPDMALLKELAVHGRLSREKAHLLLPALLRCFGRQHEPPLLRDYLGLLDESAEMAWIATEGNAFNHVTDRVEDVAALAEEQRRLGRPLKEKIEISSSGRVRQTAFKADPVSREFVGSKEERVWRHVPGSFYEFIQRALTKDERSGTMKLDLTFDSSNAQGIFRMTDARA